MNISSAMLREPLRLCVYLPARLGFWLLPLVEGKMLAMSQIIRPLKLATWPDTIGKRGAAKDKKSLSPERRQAG